jgi:hypothetical protein
MWAIDLNVDFLQGDRTTESTLEGRVDETEESQHESFDRG